MRTFLVDDNHIPIDMRTYNPNPNSTSLISIVDYNIPDGYNLYDVTFHSDTVHTLLTSKPDAVNDWLTDTLHLHQPHPFIIALHLESQPNNNHQPATLHLCVDRRCVIYQLAHAQFIPFHLSSFLRDPNHTFIGVGIDAHAARLLEILNLPVANCVDLRSLAADVLGDEAMTAASLTTLARRVLGKDVEKPESVARSSWDRVRLTAEQVKYATVDAFACYEIGRRLYCNAF
ncbi:uncharacterized protein LOC130719189 [Lotus japonicus]|uniref:uncharacterized protein LOC130719189 n=1 Tax=Lotus japonicus TaxID=34305 RepID=UPI00258DCCDD|nr:uncharacterized protein LOC130719189 [Lotus japonicus]